MTGEKKIVGLWRGRGDAADPAADGQALTAKDEAAPAAEPQAAPEPLQRGWLDPLPQEPMSDIVTPDDKDEAVEPGDRLIASLLLLAALGWCGLVGWIASNGGTRVPPLGAWPQLGLTLAGPLAVVLLLWIARLLSSRARTAQFGAAARALRSENLALTASVAGLADQLAAARAAMQEQGQALQQFGLDAAARLHDSSSSLRASADHIVTANQRLAVSGETAHQRMEGLLAGLPRVDDVAQRLAENFAQAGRVAHQHGANLEAQLALLSERAGAADAAVLKLMEQLGGGFKAMEAQVEKLCNTVSLRSDAAAAVQKRALGLIAKEQEAIEARVAETLGALQRVTDEARARLAEGCETSIGDLETRLSAATQASSALAAELAGHAGVAEQMVAVLGNAVTDVDLRLAELDAKVQGRSDAIGQALADLAGRVDSFAERSTHGQQAVASLVDGTEALILALDSAARELNETLPAAFARLDASSTAARTLINGLGDPLAANAALAEAVQSHLDASQALASSLQGDLETMQAEQLGSLAALQTGLAEAEARLRALADGSGSQAEAASSAMLKAIADVRAASQTAAHDARELIEAAIDEAGNALRERAAGALDAAMKSEIDAQLRAIEAAADRAVAAANGAADKLMRQLITIMDASASVEQRLADAEAAIANSDRDTLAKQVVVLTESLKSTAVDLTKILSQEVSDAAWDAYLKGDRGIFARRAVSLIDKSEAREIFRRYQSDQEFQRHVNHYIHDFEAILRALMGTRDGQALSVTLLSSDVGKLYVALAQAIDRLRS
jgi:hypothetical protein